jgi:bacillithiol system protein YtxJ
MTAITPLLTPEDAERAVVLSREKTVIVYKHSPICSVSSVAVEEFEEFAEGSKGDAALFSVDVVRARPTSMKIQDLTGVRHESPQVLILVGGECIWHTSHHEIQARALQTQMAALEK